MNTKGTMLVTGATGLLGSHLALCGIEEGMHVICLARPDIPTDSQAKWK